MLPRHRVGCEIRDNRGSVHRRLARGFVVATRFEDNARVVTFAKGTVVCEQIVGIDDQARRIAYSVDG